MKRLPTIALCLFLVPAIMSAGKPAPPPAPEPDWKIVYVSSATDRMELVLTVPDGSQKKTLHSVKNVSDTTPSFTPDGRHVVFTSNIGGLAGIYAIRIEDPLGQPSIGKPTLLATVTPWSRNCHPSVSAERILAFSDRADGATIGDLYLIGVTVDSAGDLRPDPLRPRRNVTNTPDLYEVWPSWSIADPPTARRLAFTRYTGADALATMTCVGMDCSAPVTIPVGLGPDLSVGEAVGWSKITPGLVAFGYTIMNTGTSSDLYFVDVDHPERQGKLTDTPSLDLHEAAPQWAPGTDDRIVAFASRAYDGLVIFEGILTRMVSGPTGAETTLAMPTRRTGYFSSPDWKE